MGRNDCLYLAQLREKWRTLVNALINHSGEEL